MAAKSFGTRGLAPAPARIVRYEPATPTPSPRVREAAPAAVAQDDAEASETARLFALFPLLTAGIIIFLSLVFAAQKHFAFDIRDNDLSLGSIVALGGASRRLVFEGGEWWRVFLAPIYHGSLSHLVGNCVALAFLGARLEPLLGRWSDLSGRLPVLIISQIGTAISFVMLALAQGVPIGGELDYLDDGTITAALRARRKL